MPGSTDHNGSERQDAIVVGGGVIGLACAWRAAQAGLRVRVLERDAPGAGASGVAAGMLAPVGEASFGEERLLDMALASHSLWPEFAAELGDVAGLTGYAEFGALHVALDRDEAAELRRRYELMRSLGLDASSLRPSECRALEPGLAPAVSAGVFAPHEAAVAPRRLVEALRRACEAVGVEVRAGTGVVEAIRDGERLAGVITADGAQHRAETIVIAAGAWSGALGWLPAEALPPVRPVKGQIITLRGPADEPVCERIVASERIYIVPRDDGRLIVGATVEEMGFDTRVTAGGVHELLREGYRALPDIAELELEEVVVGFRPGTPDNVPVIGRGALEGLLWATGHFRNGVLLAPVTARAIAATLTGKAPGPELEAARPERFATGAEVA